MYSDVIIAGLGGQGILFMGNLLAQAAMNEDQQVTYMPAYGPEMRGGTANCTVIISDREIGSPVIYRPRAAVVMNKPSLDKFGPRVLRGGLLVINSSLIEPGDITVRNRKIVSIPANDLAAKAGDERLGNMVALGAFVTASKVVRLETVIAALTEIIQKKYQNLIPVNVRCLEQGRDFVRSTNLRPQQSTNTSIVADTDSDALSP